MTGKRPVANWSAAPICICRPHNPAAAMFERLPSLAPLAFLAARAPFVRSDIRCPRHMRLIHAFSPGGAEALVSHAVRPGIGAGLQNIR